MMHEIKEGMNKAISMAGILCLLFISCDQSQQQPVDAGTLEAIESKLDEADSRRAVLVESIIRASPTLAETGEIFARVGTSFKREYLNDINNVEKYNTLRAQGINLGIYLADLGYITSFEQSQEVIFYMNCAQKLAEGIGVSNVFDEKTVERMEMNMQLKDSIIALISELYWKTDGFLKELNRENISALIICGGWIEGMHIGSKLLEEGYRDEVIYRKILLQQNNLKKILSLLETFHDEPNVEMFRERLSEISADFDAIPPLEEGKPVSPEQMDSVNAIAVKIETLRTEISQP